MSSRVKELAERLSEVVSEAGVLVEELDGCAYQVMTSEALKNAAIRLGIDHTREPTWVLDQIVQKAQKAQHAREEAMQEVADRVRWCYVSGNVPAVIFVRRNVTDVPWRLTMRDFKTYVETGHLPLSAERGDVSAVAAVES